jgi:hypothetical protein
MSKPNPIIARAGKERRFIVPPPVRKGFLRHVATLHDRVPGSGYDGLTFKGITSHCASLAAWVRAANVVERDASTIADTRMSVKLSPRARRLIDAGEVLAGERWQSALSRAAGVSQSYLAMIATGDRPVTDEVEYKIAAGLMKEADRLRLTAKKLDYIAGTILRNLEK